MRHILFVIPSRWWLTMRFSSCFIKNGVAEGKRLSEHDGDCAILADGCSNMPQEFWLCGITAPISRGCDVAMDSHKI